MIDRNVEMIKGTPVVHFLAFASPAHGKHGLDAVPLAYDEALEFSRSYGGKKFHNSHYGGGISFPTEEDAKRAIQESPLANRTPPLVPAEKKPGTRKLRICGVPAETRTYETRDGWRCGVSWMLTWGAGGSVLGRGTYAEEAEEDFLLRAKDDGFEVGPR